jgi:hypothetical protein
MEGELLSAAAALVAALYIHIVFRQRPLLRRKLRLPTPGWVSRDNLSENFSS